MRGIPAPSVARHVDYHEYCLAEGAYLVLHLGCCEEESRWYLVVQGVQEDHRWWRMDSVDNGSRYCSQVCCWRVSFSEPT